MMNCMVKSYTKYLFILVIVWIISGCYSRKEGCLDIYAANYDVSSDDQCANCCQYPALKLNFLRLFGDSTYFQGDTLINQYGQKYIILGFKYYMSHFRLFQAGNPITVREAIQNSINGSIIPDDIKIALDGDPNLNIGTIRAFGKFDSLQFTLGITDDYLKDGWTILPNGHVLNTANRLNDPQGNLSSAILKFKLLAAKDTTISVSVSPAFKIKYTLQDSISITEPGLPVTGKLIADYKTLLDNVDLTAPTDTLKSHLTKNLAQFLKVH